MILENNITNINIPDSQLCSAGAYIFCCNPKGGWFLLSAKRAGRNPRFNGGKYNVPIGMKDNPQEPSNKCAQREVYEETGLQIPIEKFKLVGYDEWKPGHYGANYIVQLDGTLGDYQIGAGDWENKKYKWIPIGNINNLQWAYGLNHTANSIYDKNVNMKNTLNENTLRKIIRGVLKESKEEIACSIIDNALKQLHRLNTRDNRIKNVMQYLINARAIIHSSERDKECFSYLNSCINTLDAVFHEDASISDEISSIIEMLEKALDSLHSSKLIKEMYDDDPFYDGYNAMMQSDAEYDEMMDSFERNFPQDFYGLEDKDMADGKIPPEGYYDSIYENKKKIKNRKG